MTELELLSYPSISDDEERWMRAFLEGVEVIDLTPLVRSNAIHVRRTHRLKLPDAIIVGTAMALDLELITNDLRLTRLPGVRARFVGLKDV